MFLNTGLTVSYEILSRYAMSNLLGRTQFAVLNPPPGNMKSRRERCACKAAAILRQRICEMHQALAGSMVALPGIYENWTLNCESKSKELPDSAHLTANRSLPFGTRRTIFTQSWWPMDERHHAEGWRAILSAASRSLPT